MMKEIALSPLGRASTAPSPVNRMMASFAEDFRDGVDINLGVGYVNEQAIPRERIREAMEAVLSDPTRYRAPLNYGGPAGSPNLVRALRQFYTSHQLGGLSEAGLAEKRFVIGASGATSLLEALALLLEPGIVLTTDPIYYIFGDLLERVGHRIVAIPEDDEGLEAAALRRTLAEMHQGDLERISFLYVVTINNPSCTILSNVRREELVAIAHDLSRRIDRKVPLIIDTAYEFLIHGEGVEKPRSAMLADELGLVHEIGTLSKILAPALRIGYLIGPSGPLMNAIVQKVSDVGFSAPLITQEIATWLLEHEIDEQIRRVHASYREKAVRIATWIEELLGPYLEKVIGGQAGFYFYLTFRNLRTDEDSPFFRYLTRTTGDSAIDGERQEPHPRVIYVPGEFCVHRSGQRVERGSRELRLSYGFEDLPQICRGLELMAEAARWAEAQSLGR